MREKEKITSSRFYYSIVENFVRQYLGKIPGGTIRPEVRQQIARFIVFGLGMVIAKFFSVGAQILLGRSLGPAIYGELTMVLLLAGYFALPLINGWGLAFVKIAANGEDLCQQLQAVKALLFVVFLSSVLVLPVLYISRDFLAPHLGITNRMMTLTIPVTALYAWWILGKQIAQGFQNWYQYINVEFTGSFILFLGTVLFILPGKSSGVTMACSIFMAGYFFAGLILCPTYFKALRVPFHALYTKKIFSHGFVLLLNGLVGVATYSIDRILINQNLGPREVGIYQAHFLATYGIISAFMTITITYIFPLFCQEDKNIHARLKKLSLYQYPLTLIFSIVSGYAVLRLYAYPVSFELFSSLCLFNAFQFHVQLKTWYIASKGTAGSAISLKSQLVFLTTNVIILLLTIKHFGILAGGTSLLIATCITLAYLIKIEKYSTHERTL